MNTCLLKSLLPAVVLMSLEACVGVKNAGITSTYDRHDLRTIIPADSGRSWTYRRIEWNDIPHADTVLVTSTIVAKKADLVLKTWTILRGNKVEDGVPYAETISDDAYSHRNREGDPGSSRTILKAPVRDGNRWKLSRNESEGDLVILNADTTVEVLGKIFQHAIHVHNPPGNPVIVKEFFIAPGVGLIMEKEDSGIGGYRMELIDHTR